jgi:hypothetical protein
MIEGLSALERDLLRLHGYANRLSELVETMLHRVKFDFYDDHMGFMAFCILNKQLEHLKSICILVDNNQYRDTQLITRTMIEGLALLYWASQDSARPLRWRAYPWVEEFRRLYGKAIDPSYKEEMENMLRTVCAHFLKPKAKGKPQTEITPGDYVKGCRWEMADGKIQPVKIRRVFEDANIGSLYNDFYSDTSNWVHWNAIAIGEALQRTGETVAYSKKTKYLGAIAYVSGFMVLFQSAMFLNDYFNIGSTKDLSDLYDEFKNNSGPTDDSS